MVFLSKTWAVTPLRAIFTWYMGHGSYILVGCIWLGDKFELILDLSRSPSFRWKAEFC